MSYSEDDRPDIIVEAGGPDGFLVGLRSTSLLGQDETSPNPDSGGTQHQGSGDALAVEQTSRRDDLNGLPSQRALVTLNQFRHGWNEDGRGDITGVTTTFTALRADNVGAKVQALLHMFRVTDHVHVQNTGLV